MSDIDSELDLPFFASKLRELKVQVESTAELADLSAQPVELDQNRVGRLSRMDAMQGQAMAQASSQRQNELLARIEQALAEIVSGDYGRCSECDEFIAQARLAADPTTQLCIDCAKALELSS